MLSYIFKDEICAKHLSEMVRFPTISRSDDEQTDYEPFFALHRYLEQTYPLIHRTLEKEVIGRAALLYKWTGTHAEAIPPILLAAHLDVVPEGDPGKWDFPPFSGVIEGGEVHGRGSLDCKSNLMAVMEATEALISSGFAPKCDIYLAFGCNEEVAGANGRSSAALICETLATRGVTLGCVIDEGPGIVRGDPFEGIDKVFCPIWTAEKGIADFEISITDRGGHSMAPGKRSIIAELGQIAVDIAANPYPYRITAAALDEYRVKAPFLPENKKFMSRIGESMDELTPVLDANPFLASKFQTTTALTMISGSPQSNILPTEAKLTVNCRPLEGDTLASVQERLENIVNGRAKVTMVRGVEATKTSRTDSYAYHCIGKTLKKLVPEALPLPSLMTGGSDAKNYYPICDSVYRMSGFQVDVKVRAHNYNECFPVANCHSGPAWFFAFLQVYCGADDTEESNI